MIQFFSKIYCFGILYVPFMCFADNDDTQLLLNKMQRSEKLREQGDRPKNQEINREQAVLITINGQTYQVQDTEADLKPAIYVALNLQQWDKVEEFLLRYQHLPHYEKDTVVFAQGMLARHRKQMDLAIQSFQAALNMNPNLIRAKLELARALFEDNQSIVARKQFASASQQVDLPEQSQAVIQDYQKAIDDRLAWHGSISLGLGWNNNINQGNGIQTSTVICDSFYLFECQQYTRQMPAAISSTGLFYSATLNKRWEIGAHHYLTLRALDYGKIFKKHTQADTDSAAIYYNENTLSVLPGYQYLDAYNSFSISPIYEHFYNNKNSKYQALGWRLDAQRQLNEKWSLGLQLQQKKFNILGQDKEYFDDYTDNSITILPAYLINDRTFLYGGLQYTRRYSSDNMTQNKEWMSNIGIYHMAQSGFNINLGVIYRQTQYDTASIIDTHLRKDKQQVYLASIEIPRWKILEAVPSFEFKYIKNNSTIPWAYNYQQKEIALKFEKTF